MKRPRLNRHSSDSSMASLFMWLSSSATMARTNRMMLLVVSSVFRCSCSKKTCMGGSNSFSLRTQPMQSSRFRAKRETDFVMIISIFPAMASFIMSWKAGRCSVFVPEKPSST